MRRGNGERIHEAILKFAGRGDRLKDVGFATRIFHETIGEGSADVDAGGEGQGAHAAPPERSRLVRSASISQSNPSGALRITTP